MSTINAHPDWVDDGLATKLETWVDWAIASRSINSPIKIDHNQLDMVAEAVMEGLYSLIDAQVTIQENARAYAEVQ